MTAAGRQASRDARACASSRGWEQAVSVSEANRRRRGPAEEEERVDCLGHIIRTVSWCPGGGQMVLCCEVTQKKGSTRV